MECILVIKASIQSHANSQRTLNSPEMKDASKDRSATYRRVHETIDGQKTNILDFLKTLIRFNIACPPAQNTTPAQAWLQKELASRGLTAELFDVLPGEQFLVALLRGVGDERSIILNGHIDVVEVRRDESWSHDPFDPYVEGGRVYGRGAFDMKSGITSVVMAVDAIQKAGLTQRRCRR